MTEKLEEKVLYFGTPGTVDTTLFTVPANHKYTVEVIWLTNTTLLAATVTLARNGTAATAGNQIISAVSIAANSVYFVPKSVWEAGDTLHALQGIAEAVNILAVGADHTLG